MSPAFPSFAVVALLALLSVGCASTKHHASSTQSGAAQGPPMPATVETVRWLPAGSRIVMLPIYCKEVIGGARQDLDPSFRTQLLPVLPYEVVSVSRPELAGLTGRDQISSIEAIPPDVLRALRDKYAATAVLFTDITLYRPYRPLAIGVRSKLVSLDSLDILWAADRVVDSSDPATAEEAVHFADPTTKASSDRANQVILQSPRRFAGFAAHEIYSTLPSR
jgi:hypothetical protein